MSHLQELFRSQEPSKIYLPRWVERLSDLGITSKDPQLMRRQRLTNIFSYGSAFCVISQLIVIAVQEFAGFLFLHIILATIAAAQLSIPRLHRFGPSLGGHMLAAVNLSGIFLVNRAFGRDSQVYVYYTLAGGVWIFIFGIEHWRIYASWLVVASAGLVV